MTRLAKLLQPLVVSERHHDPADDQLAGRRRCQHMKELDTFMDVFNRCVPITSTVDDHVLVKGAIDDAGGARPAFILLEGTDYTSLKTTTDGITAGSACRSRWRWRVKVITPTEYTRPTRRG